MSRVIAGMNIQNAVFIVLAAVLGIVVQRFLGWTIPQVFLALAIANALVAICIFTLVPEFLMRFLSWVLVRGAVPAARCTASRSTCPTKARR